MLTQSGCMWIQDRRPELYHRQTDTLSGVFSPSSSLPLTKHWLDGLPQGLCLLCMCVCVCLLWVGKLPTHSLDSCQSQTQSASPPPSFSLLSLSPHPLLGFCLPSRSQTDTLTQNSHLSGDLLYTEFPTALSGSALPCPVLLLTSHPTLLSILS